MYLILDIIQFYLEELCSRRDIEKLWTHTIEASSEASNAARVTDVELLFVVCEACESNI